MSALIETGVGIHARQERIDRFILLDAIDSFLASVCVKVGDAMDDQRANALQDIVELEPRSAWLHAELWPDEGSLEGDEFLRVQAQVALLASRLLAASSLASAAILAESLRLAEIAQRSLTESAQ